MGDASSTLLIKSPAFLAREERRCGRVGRSIIQRFAPGAVRAEEFDKGVAVHHSIAIAAVLHPVPAFLGLASDIITAVSARQFCGAWRPVESPKAALM